MDTPNLLSEREYKRFSITWLEGLVTVRSGGQSGAILMEWRDPNPIGVSYVGVRTGWGATGNWKLRFEQYPAVTGQKKRNNLSLSLDVSLLFSLPLSFSLSLQMAIRDRHQCRTTLCNNFVRLINGIDAISRSSSG